MANQTVVLDFPLRLTWKLRAPVAPLCLEVFGGKARSK
jgi:hypothetical protein